MPGGFAPRFGVEAGFLILLGAGAGFADLRPVVIVAVLAGGWLLVSLVELAVWRARPTPVAPFVPQSPRDADTEPGWPAEQETPEPEVEYPLRADAGSEPSEEIEAYTRVLGAEREDEPPSEPAE